MYAIANNPLSCGGLSSGQTCQLNWTVNATGTPNSQYFLDANFTSDLVAANDSGNFQINITAPPTVYGWLNVSYQSPAALSSQNVSQSDTFNVNMTVTCVGGPCGNVNGTLRYNNSASLSPDTTISAMAGSTPFYLMYANGNTSQFFETNISNASYGYATAIGDANNDGKNDVVVTTYYSSWAVTMYENKSGGWVGTNISNTPVQANAVAIGDANNDGLNEVVIGLRSTENEVRIYKNVSGGWVETNISDTQSHVYSVAIGDVDNDWQNEIIISAQTASLPTFSINIYKNTSGSWVETDIFSIDSVEIEKVVVGDANNDGKNEVVVGLQDTANETRMYENKSGGWVETNISDEPNDVYSVAIGDANNDGKNDVVIGLYSSVNGTRMYENKSGTWVETNISNPPGTVWSNAIGDADNDGMNEVVVGLLDNGLRIFDNSSGTWIQTNVSSTKINSIALGDADRDGQKEVVIAFSFAGGQYWIRMYSNSISPLFCGSLNQGQTCTLSWTVNATGQNGTQYWLDSNFTSNYSSVPANDSGDFQVNITSNNPPNIRDLKENFSSMVNYSASGGYQFNVTVTDDTGLDDVWIEHDFAGVMTNYTVTTSQGNEYYYNYGALAAGSYHYRWWANDSQNKRNNTAIVHYEVNKGYLSISLYINGTDGDRTLFNNSVANFTANFATGYPFSINLYTNLTGAIYEYEGFEGSWLPSGWQTGSNQPESGAMWHQNSTTPLNGTYSAGSGDIGSSNMTWINVTKTFLSAGNVSFGFSVSSEANYDFLCFCMDKGCGQTGCTCSDSDGTADWRNSSIYDGIWNSGAAKKEVSAGTHTFTWCYAKDGSSSKGADMGKIDNVNFDDGATFWDTQNSPLMNYTDLSPYRAVPGYFIRADWSGNQNYTTSQASHTLTLNVTAPYGWLNVSYQSPTTGNSQNVTQYDTFNVSMNVTCIGGTCGNVTGVLRYNSSAGLNPDTNVSNVVGATPFYALTSITETNISDTPGTPYSIAIGDANNDGRNDLVIGMAYTPTLKMYENKSGGWVETTISSLPKGSEAVAIGDANNDGQNEVVVGMQSPTNNEVRMYKNISGGWVETNISDVPNDISSVAIGDADNDGKNEVVIGYTAAANGLRMYKNMSGGWVETNISALPYGATSIVIGDADNSGDNELVVGTYSTFNNVRMYKNTTGTWVETNISSLDDDVDSVVIADANNDGYNDVIAGAYSGPNGLRMYENKTGTWVETNISDLPADIECVAVGDANNDGKNEVFVGTGYTDAQVRINEVRMYQNATGRWVETNITDVPLESYYGVRTLAVEDSDNDGRNELSVGTYRPVYKLRNYDILSNSLSCGSLAQDQTCTLSWTVNAAGVYGNQYWLDANFSSSYSQVPANDSGDFRVNITYPYGWLNISYQSPAPDNSQKVYQNDAFNVSINVTCVGGICGEVLGTLRYNGTGLSPDTNVSEMDGAVPFYVEYASPPYPSFIPKNISDMYETVYSAAVGDANNDGKNEVVVGLYETTNELRIYENDSGGWVETNISDFEGSVLSVYIGDANNDGKNEIVAGDECCNNKVRMYENKSGGWVETNISNDQDSDVYSVVVGDADNDGLNEVVIARYNPGCVRMYDNHGGAWVETNISYTQDLAQAVAIGDANNDGKNEIVVGLDYTDNETRMYENESGKWVETNISDQDSGIYSIAVGDLNNDGLNEVVVGMSYITNALRMYENKSGGWMETNISDTDDSAIDSIAVGDANNDGKNELVIGLKWGNTITPRLKMYENKTGTWVETDVANYQEDVYPVLIGDADNDGLSEIIVGAYAYYFATLTEFDLPSINPPYCGSLTQGQTCTLSWTVNATGAQGTQYWLDSNFSSSYSQVPSNDSGNFQVNITSGAITVTPVSPANGTMVDRDAVNAGTADYVALVVNTNAQSTVNITFKINLTDPAIGGQTNLTIGYNVTNSSGQAIFVWDPNSTMYAGNYSWWGAANVSYEINATRTVHVYGGLNLTFQHPTEYPNASYVIGDLVRINATLKSLGPESAPQLNNSYGAQVNSTIIKAGSSTANVYLNYSEATAGNWTGNYTIADNDPLSGDPYNVSLNATANYFFTNTTNFTRSFWVYTNITVSVTLFQAPIQYGSLNPGVTENASTVGGFPLIARIDNMTNVNVNLWIASNMSNMTGPGASYIMIGNMSFANESTGQYKKNLSMSYQLLKDNITVDMNGPGKNISVYWWIAVPVVEPGVYTTTVIVYTNRTNE
jgi:hypothetical protein